MTTRVTGSGTFTPTRIWGTATFTATTNGEYNAALANLQGDTADYLVKTAKSNTRTITYNFDAALPDPADPAAEYQRALAKLQALAGTSAYLLTGSNPTTWTITYSIDTNRGPL